MAVQGRRPASKERAASIEEWANKADKRPSEQQQKGSEVKPPATQPDLPAHRIRAKSGPKKDGVLFRFNQEQRKLLDAAVLHGDTTQQALLEKLVWERLEQEYGHLAVVP